MTRKNSRLSPGGRLRVLLASTLCFSAVAAADGDLFASHEPLEVELSGPLGRLSDNRDDRTELPFTIEVDGLEQDIEVRVRGKSRLRVCRFVPMRLDFPGDMPAGSPFAGQDKIKLATHCRDDDRSEADLIQEYLAYRIFSELSEVAFRVRLARIRYADSDSPAEPDVRRYAFLIESVEELAARLDGSPAELPGVPLSHLEKRHAALMYVFQYLIGNTDWSLVAAEGEEHCCHNGKLVEIASALFYVPYDFDLAGLVNARYARPDPSLRMERVTTRRYRGFCTDREVLSTALDDVLERSDAILAIADTLPDPDGRAKEPARRYLERFFEKAGKPDRLLRRFERRCLEN